MLRLEVIIINVVSCKKHSQNISFSGAPSSFDQIVEAAKSGNWEAFQSL